MIFSDQNIPLLLAALAFISICLVALGIMVYVRGVSQRRERIRKISALESEWASTEMEISSPVFSEESMGPWLRLLSSIGLKVKPKKLAYDPQAKLKFNRAGWRGSNISSLFWGVKILMATGFPMAFLLLIALFLKPLKPAYMLFIAVSLATLGLVLPDIWLSLRTSARAKRITRGFPDALDLLVVCVEAGMGLDAAMRRVGDEVELSHPELSEELKIVNLELRAGKPRDRALRSLADRVGIDDVSSFVTTLIQTDRFGTSVAQALRVYSDTFRTARYQRAEEAAAKISTKLIFPLVLLLFPCMFVVILGPVAIQVYRVIVQGGLG